MNKSLSQIVEDLFVKSNGGEDLSAKIHRLRDEIKKVSESEDAIFGKFLELLESFQEIIPEEKQRYHAVIKALSTTSKLSQQDIFKAVNNQLKGFKTLEKGLMPALPSWRDELKAMEAKSKMVREEISKLRDKIVQFESEEKEILNGISGRQKEIEVIEKAIRELFTDIGAEITHIKNKIEEFTAESAAGQPIPPKDSMKSDMTSEKKGGSEKKSEIHRPSAQQDMEWKKKCPMCEGQMNYHSIEKIWLCYTCAYEELDKDEVQVKSEEKSEDTNTPEPAPASESIIDPSPPFAVSSSPPSSKESQHSKKESSPAHNQTWTKSKTCPVCHKKMYLYPEERTWRCPSCEYERRI